MRTRIIIAACVAILIACATTVFVRSGGFHEFAWGCDPFGYLQNARAFKDAFRERHLPDFTLRSPQQNQAVKLFLNQRLPLQEWEQGVGPHATQYYSGSGRIGVMYPPGTGLLLSFFPSGSAISWINRLFILLLVTGILLWSWRVAIRSGSWHSPAMLALSGILGFDIVRRMGDTSFSVQCSLLLITGVCLAQEELERTERFPWVKRTLDAIVGALLGLGVLSRLALLFLIPGFLLKARGQIGRLVTWGLGLAVAGGMPLLAFQYGMTGNPFHTTYGHSDTATARWDRFLHHLDFYLGAGPGGVYNWVLVAIAVGFVSIFVSATIADRRRLLRYVLIPAAALLVIPGAFFLFHDEFAAYYLLPSTFAAALSVSLGVASWESAGGLRSHSRPSSALAAVPLLCVLGWGFGTGFLAKKPFRTPGPADFSAAAPREALDPSAWVYADVYGSTLWFYHHKPTYRLAFLSKEARLTLYQYVRERHDPQYFLDDAEGFPLEKIRDEIQPLGGQLIQRSAFEGKTLYEIVWKK